TAQRNFAAAALACKALDYCFAAVERDLPVAVRKTVRYVNHVERRILELQSPVHDGLFRRTGDSGIEHDRTRRKNIRAESFESLEIDVAIGAEVHRLRSLQWRCTADVEIRIWTCDMRAAHRDDAAIERHFDRMIIVQFEIHARLLDAGRSARRSGVRLQFREL